MINQSICCFDDNLSINVLLTEKYIQLLYHYVPVIDSEYYYGSCYQHRSKASIQYFLCFLNILMNL
jgi:hypothetical protein